MLLGLKKEYGYRVFMETRHLEHLSYYFENTDQVESLDNLCDEKDSFPWEDNNWTLPYMEDFKIGHYIDYSKDVIVNVKSEHLRIFFSFFSYDS